MRPRSSRRNAPVANPRHDTRRPGHNAPAAAVSSRDLGAPAVGVLTRGIAPSPTASYGRGTGYQATSPDPPARVPLLKNPLPTVLALLGIALIAAPATAQAGRADVQTTELISRSLSGGVPNGQSGNSVISGDKRYARAIAFESDASDIVAGDVN